MELALLKIFAAGIAGVIIGYVWYHPRFFGGEWMRLSGLAPEAVERAQRRKHLDSLGALAVSVVSAYAMNYFFVSLSISEVSDAMRAAFILWLGFVVPVLSGILLWEQKPISLYLINISYWLVSFMLMSVILVA